VTPDILERSRYLLVGKIVDEPTQFIAVSTHDPSVGRRCSGIVEAG
jgi:hypothetical protein